MSDGPHRTLPMRPGWKRVAKRGDNCAFAPAEVSAALVPALEQDCQAEGIPAFLDSLVNLCVDQENSLFRDGIALQLETLRAAAGSSIGQMVLDEAIRFAESGEQGRNIAIKALNSALADRAVRGVRQVEEHYLRKSTTPRASRVRGRINEAIGISREAIGGLAHRMLKLKTSRRAIQPLKQQDLDDGVSL